MLHIGKHLPKGFFLFCSITAIGILPSARLFPAPVALANLNYSNPDIKTLREEVKYNLKASKTKSDRNPLTPLKFYTYKVTKDDNFFTIMAKTSMDMDTLTSINKLSSPYDIYTGQKLLIPNMRGIYHDTSQETKQELARLYRISPDKIIYDKMNSSWFIPGGRLQGKEKMFFYGHAFAYPLDDFRVTSRYGKRSDPFTNKQTFHGGVDLAAPKGSPIFASADGVIEFVGKRGGYGNLIIIKHELGYETRYGHMNQFATTLQAGKLTKGTRVKKGEKIGEVGMTGRATGNHLHFEVRRFSKVEKPVLR
ncbi:MAG: M23 family metallopeptidase [Leptospira sp.]|nr:M23 family metallopeptidase [Leptospira sp.]